MDGKMKGVCRYYGYGYRDGWTDGKPRMVCCCVRGHLPESACDGCGYMRPAVGANKKEAV